VGILSAGKSGEGVRSDHLGISLQDDIRWSINPSAGGGECRSVAFLLKNNKTGGYSTKYKNIFCTEIVITLL